MALVVKVKYDTVLRRFNVYAREDGSLDLTLAGLRSKICELFQFNSYAQFIITYVDEDNDVVTMADDNDLLDVLHQGLNPLRLEVSLMSQNNRATEKQPRSQPSTPRNSSIPKEQGQAFDLRSICSDETLELLPEPLRKAMLKCAKETLDLASPAVAELMDGVINLASSHVGPLMQRQQTAEKNSGTEPNNTVPLLNVPVEQGTVNARPTSGDCFVPSSPVGGIHGYGSKGNHGYGEIIHRIVPSPSPVGEIHGYGLKGNHGFGENIHRTFHKGVQCDGCGMHPIIGPRYKSIVKNDYDLCQRCFSESGNEEEYMRLDRPLYRPATLYRPPHKERSFHGRRHFHKSPGFYPSKCPALNPYAQMPAFFPSWNSPASIYGAQAPSAGKPANKAPGKFDCRFVQDVTIFDGTQLAPGTPFTKIWRLRNNGTLSWPHQTQLVRVGGDDLGAGDVVNLEIQEQGYQVDDELDAAVDFLAPIQPGRYVSYWRLMAPSGQKFGQRVWVLIQVVPPREDSLPDLMESLLTLKEAEQNNISQGQTEQNTAVLDASSQDTSEKPSLGDNKTDLDPNELRCSPMVVDKGKGPYSPVEVGNVSIQSQRVDVPTEVQGASSMNFEVMPTALGSGYSSAAKSDPVHDASLGHIAMPASAPSLVGSETFFVGKETEDSNVVEQTLLHELEDMGFNQRMLNAELLRKHNYDLQKTLDDLCNTAEWDPILEELQEMGFHDSEMNRTLLVKNEGSVKRVVLDLLSAEKDASMQPNLSKKAKQS